MQFVHRRCLQEWVSECMRSACELCSFKFNAEVKPRYGYCQSITIWMRKPIVRAYVFTDAFMILSFFLITMILCTMCLYFMNNLSAISDNSSLSINYTGVKVLCYLPSIVIMISYLIYSIIVIRRHYILWHAWWKRNVTVTLRFDENEKGGNKQ